MTGSGFLTKWIIASGTGMALGFLTFINVLMVLGFGLNFDLWWSEAAVEGFEEGEAERLLRVGLIIGLPLAGVIFTSCQAAVLRDSSVNLRFWILAGPLGFVLPLLIIWPLTAIWGDIPGPVEPLTIVGGGLIGTAVLQWWSLYRDGMESKRWLVLWVVGLPLGIAAYMVTYTIIDMVASVSWAGEVALIGFAVGGGAAALSGGALLRTISAETSPVP